MFGNIECTAWAYAAPHFKSWKNQDDAKMGKNHEPTKFEDY
jgi:hypothetical protein